MPIPHITQYAIHHTAARRVPFGSQLQAVNEYHRTKDWGNGWRQEHTSSLGWWVGYNYFIDIDGKVTNTRKVGEETIANIGHNCNSDTSCDTISVCLAGDFNQELPTEAQISSLKALIAQFEATYGKIHYTFHRLIQPGRTCPGSLFTEEYFQRVVMDRLAPIADAADEAKKKQIEALQTQTITLLQRLIQYLISKTK